MKKKAPYFALCLLLTLSTLTACGGQALPSEASADSQALPSEASADSQALPSGASVSSQALPSEASADSQAEPSEASAHSQTKPSEASAAGVPAPQPQEYEVWSEEWLTICSAAKDAALNGDGQDDGRGDSYLFGYIKDYDAESLTIDPIEWITDENTKRIQELQEAGVIGESDFIDDRLMDGYFLYNPEEITAVYPVDEKTAFYFVDAFSLFTEDKPSSFYKTTDFKEFSKFLEKILTPRKKYGPPGGPPGGPYIFKLEDGILTNVCEGIIAG